MSSRPPRRARPGSIVRFMRALSEVIFTWVPAMEASGISVRKWVVLLSTTGDGPPAAPPAWAAIYHPKR